MAAPDLRLTVQLTFTVPPGVTRSELRDFITEALEAAGGCRHPSDPLFHSLGDVTLRNWKGPRWLDSTRS